VSQSTAPAARTAVRTTWDWFLARVPKPPYRNVDRYDVDGFETSQAAVAAMHEAGIRVACYLSAGRYEKYRPDAPQFPAELLGRKNGWPGERWLGICPERRPPCRGP